ncbi:hypothetical protein cyc_03786 [Cyclospora cayetanensis]|uniref:Uncharacterized protein n=1 Tax=Cyclospora cayetanensis TaxID=88456 RepID=A0A1D3D1L5_9EIME|nr:hypothetical protein cyc_03786 [Cyclospora cayetanensis]
MPSSQKRRLSPVEHAPPIQPAEQKYQNQELRHQLRQQSPCVLSGRKRALPSEVPVSKACRIRTSNEGEAAIAAVPTEVQAATAGVGASCLTAAVSEEKPTMGSAPPPDAPSSCVALVPYGQNHIYEPLLRPLQQQQDLLMQQNLADPLAALSEIQEPQHFIRGLTAAEAVAKAGVLLIPASTRASKTDALLLLQKAQQQQLDREDEAREESEDDEGVLLRTTSQTSQGAMSVD